MAATTFTQLPRELRDMIWSLAAPIQYQYIVDSQPISCISPRAERLRQAFVGHENLPHDTEKQPLRVYIYDSCNRDNLRLGGNEFQTLVNCLPMATVCSEARSQATTFCHAQIGLVNLFYAIDAPNEPSDTGDTISEPIFLPRTTVMITNAKNKKDGPKGFNSGEHLVDIVNRVFGSCVERIILNSWFKSSNTLEEFFWPHTAQILELGSITPPFEGDQGHDQPAVFMTPEWTAYRTNEFLDQTTNYELRQVAQYLLKFREIFDASTEKLPRLQSIELELHTYCWDDVLLTHIKATNKNGVLWADSGDVQIEFNHRFDGFDGFMPKRHDEEPTDRRRTNRRRTVLHCRCSIM
ncbi:hypothetical protein K504DRAFT_464342 [Pleomassaria siparia CBS 279.74]|uniref:2EXR domain-containing protein n=1 Tax=Pleomassaria siparia CBS 279.74 TaxID=1314801 RepID=A0A6G1KHD6_9PLEO|nr:hypothetical protein K504DRAFT_464342 [Pleomassaria siparia CBS 279.74]